MICSLIEGEQIPRLSNMTSNSINAYIDYFSHFCEIIDILLDSFQHPRDRPQLPVTPATVGLTSFDLKSIRLRACFHGNIAHDTGIHTSPPK